jgi:hypothetical protein
VPSANAFKKRPEPLKLVRMKLTRTKKKSFRALCNFRPRNVVVGINSG